MAGDGDSYFYDESALLEDEKAAAASISSDVEPLNSSPTPPFSSASVSHWSSSWSKPTEFCTNSQPSLLPIDNSIAEPAVDEFSPSSSLYKRHDRAIAGAGLRNLFNTCFLNSVMQCFIHTVPLLQPILSNGNLMRSGNNYNNGRFSVLCALRDLILQSLVSTTAIEPRDLVDNLSHISSNFQRYQQEDAHEFLQCFLDRLESCHEPENKSDNIVQKVFGGRLVSSLKCCNCGHCSDTYEPSIDLSLEIDDADDLCTALHSFTKVEKIEDPETKFTCEKCKEQVDVEKKLSYDEAPSVAVFHLKRFKNDGSVVEKIDKHVAFPLNLDLQPYTGSGKQSNAELQYVLYAVVVHIGITPTSGHYYSLIRLSPDIWCKFDDSEVELVSVDYVLSQEAYVLFYAKDSTPWFSSFIETQKEFVNSTIWNTSPKSVLDKIDTSVPPCLDNKFECNTNKVSCDTAREHKEGNDNEVTDNGAAKSKIKRKVSIHDLQDSVTPLSGKSSNMSLPNERKVSPVLLEKVNHNQEVGVPQRSPIDIEAVFRSPSPEIYREASPDAGFTLCRSKLRSGDRIYCKRRLEEDMDDERKQARSFVMKNMPSSRAQQLMAAMRGSKTEPPANRKKTRRVSVR